MRWASVRVYSVLVLTLLVLQGPDKGQRFELPDAATVIGRAGVAAGGGGGAEIALSDNTVSRRHCEIGNKDGIHLLKDLGSANGTYVNGLKVKSPQAVRVGDQLRVGRTLMAIGSAPGFSPSRGEGIEFAGAESGMDSAIMHTASANDESLVLAVPEPTAGAVANLQVLYKLGAALGASFDAGQAMGITLDLVFEHIKPERGMILLKEEKSGQLEPVVVRTREGELAVGERLHASQTIIDHVLRTGHGVLSQNAMEDKRFSSGKSVHSMAIRSALCVPILGRPPRPGGGEAVEGAEAEILGIIYIDSSKRNYTYSPDQLRLLGAIGLQAGMAVQSAKLYQAAVRAERLAAVGETTAALAHAIKNILQAMRGGADVVEMGLSRKDLVQAGKGWGVVSRSLTRILGVTQNLLAYSRPRTPQTELVDVGELVRDCVELIAERAAEKKVMVVADEALPRPPKVPMDEGAMHQVVMNLLGNAVDAVGEKRGGLVRVRTVLEGERAVVEVADNGGGVEKALEPHLFELFQSTKGNRGTGLGLAVSKKIVEEHEGEISYSGGGELGGAMFRVRLPVRVMEGE